MAIKPLQSITLKNDNGEDTTYVVASAPAIVETTEPADVASFSDGAEGIPVKSLIADINPVQTGSGDPSPSNVRPITGWTGMNITRTGKNLLPNKKVAFSTNTWIGTDSTSDDFYFYLPVGTYTLSAVLLSGNTLWMRSSKATSNTRISSATVTTTPTGTFTVTEADYYRFWVNGVSPENVVNFQLEVGSLATTYEPYNGTTYPISWEDEAGTVYGGTLDVTTGLLTVTHELKAISEFSWTQYQTNPIVFYTTVSGKAFGVSNIMSDAFSVTGASVSSMTAGTMRGIATQAVVYIAANSTDPTDFVHDYGTNQLLYELATPQTYQLTPQAVTTILGQNNIWADTGDVEVAYCADTKMYIDKMISEL